MKLNQAFKGIIENISGSNSVDVISAARPFLLSALYEETKRPLLVVSGHAENCSRIYEQIKFWNSTANLVLYPEPSVLPYERMLVDKKYEIDRISAIGNLTDNSKPCITVITAHAFMMKQPSPHVFRDSQVRLKTGQMLKPHETMLRWAKYGYRMTPIVESPGEMAKRGGLIDIYPPLSDKPVRIDLFGDFVDSIRYFDPETQRSIDDIEEIIIGPASGFFPSLGDTNVEEIVSSLDFDDCDDAVKDRYKKDISALFDGIETGYGYFYEPFFNRSSILTHLPENALVVFDELSLIKDVAVDLDEKASELRDEFVSEGKLPGNFPKPYLTWPEIASEMKNMDILSLDSFLTEDKTPNRLTFTAVSGFLGQIDRFTAEVHQKLDNKRKIVIVSQQAPRLQELLADQNIPVEISSQIDRSSPDQALSLVDGFIPAGWAYDNDLFIYSDYEIFGFTKQRRYQKKESQKRKDVFADFNPGDFVVHIDHGIGRFMDFHVRKTNGVLREYIAIAYADEDYLYVPIEQIDRLSRYVGAGDSSPRLNRLGTAEWEKTKGKVKEATEKVAQELLDLYTSRQQIPGFKYSSDTIWQRDLEGSFPYMETPDQLTALEQVKVDMQSAKPMDRLICGDVGYGKTEIAVRAAFKAVMDGKQVAVLVPTTILAQQHFETFTQRMKAFPLSIEILSRLRTKKQQAEIIERMQNGEVDICIGTHRLLQKDIKFQELGLLIIDEEQRFGVQHKERMKQMRQQIDVLTLSATPIPRTLHMAMVGVRDMSVIETPPDARLPIRTYVAEYDDKLIREAIIRELEREGQVFFVHNNVLGIDIMAEKIRKIVPEARVTVGHGQMDEGRLEQVTEDFIHGKYDVLVCTTIIESGLDIPNANTIIVNKADRFGLTQLYQLRGRVGRGVNLAYAYFLFDRKKIIKPVAEKRLRIINEATELGAGFNIAVHDLEIRGAGTLLGVQQTGHITSVGFNLYSQMLSRAVEDKKQIESTVDSAKQIAEGRRSKIKFQTVVDLPLHALLPDDYMPEAGTRVSFYRRLSEIIEDKELDEMKAELQDRFGIYPEEVENILYIIGIKIKCIQAGVEHVYYSEGEVFIRYYYGTDIVRDQLRVLSNRGVSFNKYVVRFPATKNSDGWKRTLFEILERTAVRK